jgi:integrase
MLTSELDLDDAATWTIPGSKTKNGKPHIVPLSALAVRLIRGALDLTPLGANDRPVFPSPRGRGRRVRKPLAEIRPIGRNALSQAMAHARKQAGLADVTTHDLRRSAASHMVSERLGVTRYVVSRILNHADAGGGAMITSKVYALSDDLPAKRAALNSWAGLVDEFVGGKAAESNVVAIGGRG